MRVIDQIFMAKRLLTPNMYELKQKCDSPMYRRPKKMMAVDRQEQLQSWQIVQGQSLKNSQMISPEVFYFFFILIMYEAPSADDYAQLINEQYKIWKKHVPFLYELLLCHQLPTPSPTIQFLDSTTCLLGTTSTERNSLLASPLHLPSSDTLCDMTQYKQDCRVGELGLRKMEVGRVVAQNAEVMRVRVGGRESKRRVVCKTGGAEPEVNVYDGRTMEEVVRLEGHTAEGYGVDWNTREQRLVVSGGMDRRICVWDVEAPRETGNALKPICEYHFHSTGVEDVNWNKINENVFASCGQDRLIAIWDIKEKKKKPEFQKTGHSDQIYTLDFCPSSQMLLLSGGQDSQINLWDLRNISKKVHTFSGHVDSVNKVQWSPTNRLVFASASSDRRVIIWDISKIGEPRQHEDPAEMVFIHGGHRSRVLDFDWSPNGNIIASTEEGSTWQVWRQSPATEEQVQEEV